MSAARPRRDFDPVLRYGIVVVCSVLVVAVTTVLVGVLALLVVTVVTVDVGVVTEEERDDAVDVGVAVVVVVGGLVENLGVIVGGQCANVTIALTNGANGTLTVTGFPGVTLTVSGK